MEEELRGLWASKDHQQCPAQIQAWKYHLRDPCHQSSSQEEEVEELAPLLSAGRHSAVGHHSAGAAGSGHSGLPTWHSGCSSCSAEMPSSGLVRAQ